MSSPCGTKGVCSDAPWPGARAARETSLHDLLAEQGRLDVEAALRIAASLADTLEALHGRGVIHKDVKPRNVMIDRSTGATRLVDFGISTCLSRETASAATPDALEGTLAYMSPEQTGRVNRAVDLRTDLYSLGVTLHEMLAGAPPFSAADPMELVHSHIARAPVPLHEISKGVPEALSDVVLRLLSKAPEERYQSARGLKADLEACLSRWTATGWIDPFPLGRQDRTGALRIPQKLYGRERDVAALLSAFGRVREGASELILIGGYSGVGKSALVNELHRPIAQRGGALVRGKFDPQSRDTPLAPVVNALRELVRQVLTEPPAALDAWRTALLGAVGRSGRLLTELLPELELVIGPQPEVSALGPAEARNRFDLVMRRFVRVFATAERPLVLFLDDLQWADPASLRLLGLLLGDKDRGHILLVGAYRDNEVDGAHPLTSTLDSRCSRSLPPRRRARRSAAGRRSPAARPGSRSSRRAVPRISSTSRCSSRPRRRAGPASTTRPRASSIARSPSPRRATPGTTRPSRTSGAR
ncbi:serine/threonine protein kinase [Sorangium sp. So ce513]|uniref:serine/threonine protein kinase n=1 Tax=Sorangium sp. So ce513 TaxID=3133315 RepID=UPI003F645EE8